MFMEANTEARLLQSEYEDNITRYVRHAPGFMAGMSFEESIKQMNHVYEPFCDPETEQTVYISFDIHKWSPGTNPEVHSF